MPCSDVGQNERKVPVGAISRLAQIGKQIMQTLNIAYITSVKDIVRLGRVEDSIIDPASSNGNEAGFSLVEAAIAQVIILIALLGVVSTFAYVINYNAGNNSRSQALAVLQQQVEILRAAKFTPTVTDSSLTGGTKTPFTVTTTAGFNFSVQVVVDNNPLLAGIQDDTAVPAPTLKEITVTTRLVSPSPGWQTAVPTSVVLRRTRAN
jgi:type II secretory pathway pseudopilin PulG